MSGLRQGRAAIFNGQYEQAQESLEVVSLDSAASPVLRQELEFYRAYSDYNDVMEMAEQMISYAAQEVLGTTRITYQGNEIDLAPPWPRRSLRQAIKEESGIDYKDYPDAQSLYQAIQAIGGNVEPNASKGKLIDVLLSSYVEPKLIHPTFLVDYPLELSPLAKAKPGSSETVERFEGFAGGMEICNAYSELNDPLDQEERFLAHGRAYEAGDEDAHQMDRDWLTALSYGMPLREGLAWALIA